MYAIIAVGAIALLGLLGWLPAVIYGVGAVFLFVSIFVTMTAPIWIMYYVHKLVNRKQ